MDPAASTPASPSGRLLRGLGNAARWRDGEKVALGSGITLAIVLGWMVRLALVAADPSRGPYLDPNALGPMQRFLAAWAAGQLGLFAIGLGVHRERERRPLLVATAVHFWFACFALALYAIGPYTSPFALLAMVFTVTGMLVFGSRTIAGGVVTFAALLAATTLAERAGWLPYAPILVDFPYAGERPQLPWILSLGVMPMLASGLVLVLFAQVLAQSRARERELEAASRTDYLTGVWNRRAFMEHAEREFARTLRHRRPIALVIVDVDHFKRVNDRHGHAVGDEVLKVVAHTLAAGVRCHDAVSRWGGEEFAILLTETDAERARVMAERCRARLEGTRLLLRGQRLRITASLGIATAPHEELSRVEDLIERADAALYAAKQAGRNRVTCAA